MYPTNQGLTYIAFDILEMASPEIRNRPIGIPRTLVSIANKSPAVFSDGGAPIDAEVT